MNFVQVITIPPLVTLPLSLVQVMKVHPPLIMNASNSTMRKIIMLKIQNASPRTGVAEQLPSLTYTLTTDDANNLHTIKNAIVFISEHILVQFGVSK